MSQTGKRTVLERSTEPTYQLDQRFCTQARVGCAEEGSRWVRRNTAPSALVQQLFARRLPRRAGDFRRRFACGARAGRASALERTRGPALERFPPGQEYPIVSGRPAAA